VPLRLVGSEMCIRDSLKALWANWQSQQQNKEAPAFADAS
jgi:hypothetical protein